MISTGRRLLPQIWPQRLGFALRLAQRPLLPIAAASAFGVFHCASAGTTTWFARTIMAGATERGIGPMAEIEPITTAEYPTKARRPAYSKLATGKIKQVYGITLPYWQSNLSVCLDRLISLRA
jgi:dTDP-4-dehydrorhamnose reductase